MFFTKEEICSLDTGTTKEWLLTNGIGGFAAGTVIGCNTRRYHGLLIASFKPPVKRHLIVSNVHEMIEFDNTISYLSSFECGGNYAGKGFKHLQEFQNNFIPTWHYVANGMDIKKQIFMIYGENTTVVKYIIKNGNKAGDFKVYPLVNFREYHGERRDFSPFSIQHNNAVTEIKFDEISNKLKMICEGMPFIDSIDSFYNMYYKKEAERGLTTSENHFMPGYFESNFKPFEKKEINIIFTVENKIEFDINTEYEKAISRQAELVRAANLSDPFANQLVKAADAFIVKRESTGGKTIVAGYPWFTDWGRDTLISLTGLTLATKRFDDAKSILKTFEKYIKGGLIPNVFQDMDEAPGYNTVDASLWFFEAVYNYIKYTEDKEFLKEIYGSLEEVFNRFTMTKENILKVNTEIIYMDTDNLIYAGNKDTQLTWMDAKVGNFAVTPRYGKAVEINALWYNAAMIMDKLSKKLRKKADYGEFAKKIKESFIKEFWNEEDKYLYDVVNEEGKDTSIRPNQIFAAALNFPVIEKEKAEKVFNIIAEHLYTPVGLRSLSPTDANYKDIYMGDLWSRDTAYHQGTVWAWLLGAFITASKRLGITGEYSAKEVEKRIEYHLKEEGLGQISEIFDAKEPFTPRGCFAQAWSVAEILRAITEDN